MTFIKKVFKWNKFELVKAITGIFIFCLALNLFIMPNHLYNGGVLGTAQLVRTLLVNTFNIDVNFDIAGIINLIFNIPLFILAYKEVSKCNLQAVGEQLKWFYLEQINLKNLSK